jgi:hypothetical protein
VRARLSDGADHLVELQLEGASVAVLRVLEQHDEQQRDDRGYG